MGSINCSFLKWLRILGKFFRAFENADQLQNQRRNHFLWWYKYNLFLGAHMNLHKRLSFNKYFSRDTAKYQHFKGSIQLCQQQKILGAQKICYFSSSPTQIKLKNIFSVGMNVGYMNYYII